MSSTSFFQYTKEAIMDGDYMPNIFNVYYFLKWICLGYTCIIIHHVHLGVKELTSTFLLNVLMPPQPFCSHPLG